MVDHEALLGMLGRLRLTVLRDQLDGLLDEAARRELTLREALAFLCEREIARRDQRRVEMAVRIAHFPFARDLRGFDFAAQPSLDPGQVRELATARFVANGEAVLLPGPPGAGETHLAVALGHEAIRQGDPAGPLGPVRHRPARSSPRSPRRTPGAGWRSGCRSSPSRSC